MTDYIQLSAPPQLCIQYPTCSACCVDLDNYGGDSWTCPVCGTSWDMNANDGDTGILYADWSGEEPTGPHCTENDAHRWGHYHKRMEEHRLFPNIIPEPRRPGW